MKSSYEPTTTPDAKTQHSVNAPEPHESTAREATSAATVERICRNCGHELTSVTQDICSNGRACEERAPFAMPRTQIVLESERHDEQSPAFEVHDSVDSLTDILEHCRKRRAEIAALPIIDVTL